MLAAPRADSGAVRTRKKRLVNWVIWQVARVVCGYWTRGGDFSHRAPTLVGSSASGVEYFPGSREKGQEGVVSLGESGHRGFTRKP